MNKHNLLPDTGQGHEHVSVPDSKKKIRKGAPLGLRHHVNEDVISGLGESGSTSHTPQGKNSGKK